MQEDEASLYPVILSTTSFQISSSKLVEEPEEIQPNVQDTQSG